MVLRRMYCDGTRSTEIAQNHLRRIQRQTKDFNADWFLVFDVDGLNDRFVVAREIPSPQTEERNNHGCQGKGRKGRGRT